MGKTLALFAVAVPGVVATLASLAWAAPSSNVAWDVETMALIRGADPAKGKELAANCAGCHGAEGVSSAPANPHLAGQAADYTYKQLKDYKDGTRANALMQAMVSALSDQDMADLAAFYANQTLPGQGGAAPAPELVRRGDGKRLIPSCNSCHHEPKRRKHHGMAILDGQTKEYLVATLNAYRSGARANDVYAVMRSIADEMTDAEITATADYYAQR
jgi:cytochrome c553